MFRRGTYPLSMLVGQGNRDRLAILTPSGVMPLPLLDPVH